MLAREVCSSLCEPSLVFDHQQLCEYRAAFFREGELTACVALDKPFDHHGRDSRAVQVFGRRHARCQPRAPAAGVRKAPPQACNATCPQPAKADVKAVRTLPTCGALSSHRTPGIWGIRMGYAGGYAGGFRTPQLYPPARVQIATQIQSASRSLGDQNQPRLAPRGSAPRAPNLPLRAGFHFRQFIVPSQIATHLAFSQMDVVASLGALFGRHTFHTAVHPDCA